MADAPAKSKIPGWLKAGASSVFGLVSGAVLMYVTPLVQNAVKPPEPIANFGFQAQGLAVTFQNRALNATDGWWDFGDGSALEPFAPQQPTIAHNYAKPGPYSVKLSLTNLFNEKADRTVTVNLDGGGAPAPVIEDFKVAPLSKGMTTPAVFHLTAKVKNADQIIWYLGESKPIEVSTETGGVQERWVTINDPGACTFRVAAVAGKQTVEKIAAPEWVTMPQEGEMPRATVTVTYEAVQVDRKENATASVTLRWPHECRDALCPVTAEWVPHGNYKVVTAEINGSGKDLRIRGVPSVQIAEDRSKVIVSAELIHATGFAKFIPPAPHIVPLKVTLEKRSAPTIKSFTLPMGVSVPGQTVIPLPAPDGLWQATKRQVTLDLTEGQRKIWNGSEMPVNRAMQLQGRPVVVNASLQADQLVLTVTSPKGVLTPVGELIQPTRPPPTGGGRGDWTMPCDRVS